MKKIFCAMFFALCGFCVNANATTYPMPAAGDDIIGGTQPFIKINVQPEDSSITIRQRYEISFKELSEANPKVDFDKLVVGQELIIPTQLILPEYRKGIVINLAELRLYYFTPDGRSVMTYPVGLGRENWRTPTTITSVASKEANPAWHIPKSIKEYTYKDHGEVLPDVVPPGPDNPLGAFALHLAQPGYLIHGTNVQESVGLYISSGCIRMQKDAIAKLYEIVPIGTPVYIVHHMNKAGWIGHNLYLESHASIGLSEKLSSLNYKDTKTAIEQAGNNRSTKVSWQLIDQVEHQHKGFPIKVGTDSDENNTNNDNKNNNDKKIYQ